MASQAKSRLKLEPKGERNLLTNLALVSPLFLVYQVGVLFTLPMINGADFVTILLFQYVGLSVTAYLGLVCGLCLVLFGTIALLGRRQALEPRQLIVMLLESAAWASVTGPLVILTMNWAFSPVLAAQALEGGSILSRVVMSFGAGLYEETVFRLGLLSLLVLVFGKGLGMKRWASVSIAVLISSVLFSAMHHIPPYGDPLSLDVFVFRVLAGVFFAGLFWFRGFAVAVYTHAFYDVIVLVFR